MGQRGAGPSHEVTATGMQQEEPKVSGVISTHRLQYSFMSHRLVFSRS